MTFRYALGAIFILSAPFLGCRDASSLRSDLVRTDGMRFVDEKGRTLIFHGVNVSGFAKRAPSYVSWHTEADYDRLKAWGMNLIRHLIFWVALEPYPGSFNDAYLEEVEERVRWAEKRGIYVLLDMHQDLYSEKYSGDGAPFWACFDDGIPFTQRFPWNLNYAEPAVIAAFDNFWTNKGLQEHFIKTWAFVAKRFKGNKTVLGYDLYNEPFPGSIPVVEFDKTYLKEFYLKLINAIRAVDPDHIIFIEPNSFTSGGFSSSLRINGIKNIGYAVHYYHPLVHEGEPYDLNSYPLIEAANYREKEAGEMGMPWILDEYGVNPLTVNSTPYLNDLLGIVDSHDAGWTYWSDDKGGGFSLLDDNGQERGQVDLIVRPYPQRLAGWPVNFSYKPSSQVFELEFKEDGDAAGTTQIFIPVNRHYASGFTYTVSDGEVVFNEEKSLLEYRHRAGLGNHRLTVSPLP